MIASYETFYPLFHVPYETRRSAEKHMDEKREPHLVGNTKERFSLRLLDAHVWAKNRLGDYLSVFHKLVVSQRSLGGS